jgi:hypothetical protein
MDDFNAMLDRLAVYAMRNLSHDIEKSIVGFSSDSETMSREGLISSSGSPGPLFVEAC